MKSLENVHVVIYSKKMLKVAITRLSKLGKEVEHTIFFDFMQGSDLLSITPSGQFGVIQCPFDHSEEITLNELCERIISSDG